MSSIVISGDTSGAITLAAPAVSGTNTATLPAATGTVMVSGNMPAFSAYQSTNQSISSSTFTKLTIDTEEFDTNNNFASSRFTPTVAGYYQINGSVQTAGAPAYISVDIHKNGSTYKYGNFGTAVYQSTVSSLVYLNGSTDYVELYGYSNAGWTSQSGSTATYFNGALVRAA